MTRKTLNLAVASALVASLAVVGCKKKEEAVVTPPVAEVPAPAPAPAPTPAPAVAPFAVTTVDVGNAIGADNRVTTPTAVFGAKDTFYAVVATDGAASGNKLTARWSFQDGQVIGTPEEKVLNGSGPMVTEFHASKPSGWPVGKYKVEILSDGAVVQTREFEVK